MPQFANRTFDQLRHMLLNDLEDVSTQAQEMLMISAESMMTLALLSHEEHNNMATLHATRATMVNLLEQT